MIKNNLDTNKQSQLTQAQRNVLTVLFSFAHKIYTKTNSNLFFTEGIIEARFAHDSERKNDETFIFTLDKNRIDALCHNDMMITMGACFIAADIELKKKFGNKFNNLDPNIVSIHRIVCAARNAFAHNFNHAKWDFSRKPYGHLYEKIWSISYTDEFGINKIISVDLTNKHGKPLNTLDFGGSGNVLLLLQCAIDILD